MQTLLRNVLLGGGGGYSPASLFAGGVEGALYDPSDLSTLYQDSAGTTPVTGVEQVVGLMLDKSQGLVSTEVAPNSGTSLTGWSLTTTGGGIVTSTASGIELVTDGSGTQIAAITCSGTAGIFYKITVTVEVVAGSIDLQTGTNVSSFSVGTTTRTIILYSSTGQTQFKRSSSVIATTAYIRNISIRELPGNHATSTGSARPTLSARVNLLTYSEEFDNGVWSKGNSSVTQNAAVAPDGTTTADSLIEDTATSGHSVAFGSITFAASTVYTTTIYVKPTGRSWFYIQLASTPFGGTTRAWFNVTTGVVGTQANCTGSIQAVGNGWYRCGVTATSTVGGVATTSIVFGLSNADNVSIYTGDGTSGIYIWGADLRPANIGVNIPSYQRIAAATNYDTNGFPFYLSFGGAQSMSTPANLDLTSTDKVTVYAGVRKLSDVAVGVVGESSVNSASNNGTFLMYAPANSASPDYGWRSGGTTRQTLAPVTYAAPITNALTGIGDISAPEVTLRINGVQAATSSNTQGTGNYGTYPLYIGARAGSSLFFNGYLYSLIIQGAAASATQLASTEAWVNQKTKAY